MTRAVYIGAVSRTHLFPTRSTYSNIPTTQILKPSAVLLKILELTLLTWKQVLRAWEATDPKMTADFLLGLIREEQARALVVHLSLNVEWPF